MPVTRLRSRRACGYAGRIFSGMSDAVVHILRGFPDGQSDRCPLQVSFPHCRSANLSSMGPEDIAALHGRAVIVLTAQGHPISIGRLRVDVETSQLPRLNLDFETENIRCSMRISPERTTGLAASWDGERYTYRLPAGDQVWTPPPPRDPPRPAQPIIETFPPPSHSPSRNSKIT